MLAVGIDPAGQTHAASVVAMQALLQLKGALMIDILTTGGDPALAVARAPLHLAQALTRGLPSSSLTPLSSYTLLGLFPGTHRALVGLPGNHCHMAREFEGLTCEFRAMYQQQENLIVLLEDVPCTMRRLKGKARDKPTASSVTTVSQSGHFWHDGYSGYRRGSRGHCDGRGLRGMYY